MRVQIPHFKNVYGPGSKTKLLQNQSIAKKCPIIWKSIPELVALATLKKKLDQPSINDYFSQIENIFKLDNLSDILESIHSASIQPASSNC